LLIIKSLLFAATTQIHRKARFYFIEQAA